MKPQLLEPRQTFDITLTGFDAGTDQTDHLIKWVRVYDEAQLERWLKSTGLWDHVEVQTPDGKRWLPLARRDTFEDGVDVMLIGEAVATRDNETFDPQVWIDESQAVLNERNQEQCPA